MKNIGLIFTGSILPFLVAFTLFGCTKTAGHIGPQRKAPRADTSADLLARSTQLYRRSYQAGKGMVHVSFPEPPRRLQLDELPSGLSRLARTGARVVVDRAWSATRCVDLEYHHPWCVFWAVRLMPRPSTIPDRDPRAGLWTLVSNSNWTSCTTKPKRRKWKVSPPAIGLEIECMNYSNPYPHRIRARCLVVSDIIVEAVVHDPDGAADRSGDSFLASFTYTPATHHADGGP